MAFFEEFDACEVSCPPAPYTSTQLAAMVSNSSTNNRFVLTIAIAGLSARSWGLDGDLRVHIRCCLLHRHSRQAQQHCPVRIYAVCRCASLVSLLLDPVASLHAISRRKSWFAVGIAVVCLAFMLNTGGWEKVTCENKATVRRRPFPQNLR